MAAQNNLGLLLERGLAGESLDLHAALALYRAAAAAGCKAAAANRDRLELEM